MTKTTLVETHKHK